MSARLAVAALTLFALIWTGAASIAHAQRGGTRIVVGEFSGPGSSKVRTAVVRALSKRRGVNIVSQRDADEAAENLGVDWNESSGAAAVASELRVNAYIDGSVARQRGRWVARLRVRSGETGEVVAEPTFQHQSRNRLPRIVQRQLWREVADAVGSSAPAEEEEEAEEEETDEPGGAAGVSRGPTRVERPARAREGTAEEGEEEQPEEEEEEEVAETTSDDEEPGLTPFELGAGAHIFSRHLTYNDDIFKQLRAYDLTLAVAPFAHLTWYPGAHLSGGVAAWFGFVAQIEHGFGITSETSDGTSYDTTYQEWLLGLRVRIPIDTLELGLNVLYGNQRFELEGEETAQTVVIPAVDYKFVQLGVDGHLALTGALTVWASFAYRLVNEAGEIDSNLWFPSADVGGIYASIGATLHIVAGLEGRIGLDIRRYFFTMNPEPGDGVVAGGAVDQYLGGTVGLAYKFD